MTVLAWQRGGVAGGPPVVLLHAWAGDAVHDFERTGWVARLGEVGADVLAPDLPGHGASAGVGIPPGKEAAAWAASALQVDLERLQVRAATVVGMAETCPVAAQLAVRAPDQVGRLVLVDCDDRTLFPAAAEVAAALRNPSARVWSPEAAEVLQRAARDRRHDRATLAAYVEGTAWPAPPRLRSITAPVLVAALRGGTRRERAPRVAQLFADARLATVDDVLEAVAGFLSPAP